MNQKRKRFISYIVILVIILGTLPAGVCSAESDKYVIEQDGYIINVSGAVQQPHYINGYCFSGISLYYKNGQTYMIGDVTNVSGVDRKVLLIDILFYNDAGEFMTSMGGIIGDMKAGGSVQLNASTTSGTPVYAYDYTIQFAEEDLLNPEDNIAFKTAVVCTKTEIIENDTITLVCEESREGVSYQWFWSYSSSGGGNRIDGATGRRYTISNISMEEYGKYYYCQLSKGGKIQNTERKELIITPLEKEPSPTPATSPTPTVSPAPTTSPKPTVSPTPTASPAPTASPKPTVSPTPTASPAPTASPKPTVSPTPTASSAPTASPTPTASSAPTASPKPTVSPSPTVSTPPEPNQPSEVTPMPEVSLSPTASPTPKVSPSPTASPTPKVSPSPTASPAPEVSPLPTSPMPKPSEENIVLGKVQKLVVEQTASLKARLSWQKHLSAERIVILRAEKKDGEFKTLKKIKGSATFYTDNTVKRGQSYYYKVIPYCGKFSKMVIKREAKICKIGIGYLIQPVAIATKGKLGTQKYVLITLKKYQGKYAEIYIKDVGKYQKLAMRKRTIQFYRGKYRFKYAKGGVALSFRVRTYQMIKGKRRYSVFSKDIKIQI